MKSHNNLCLARRGNSNLTAEPHQGWRMVLLGSLLVLGVASCGGADRTTTPSDTAGSSDPSAPDSGASTSPVSSIPFCPDDRHDDSGDEITFDDVETRTEEWDRRNAAIERVRDAYSADPAWVDAPYDPSTDEIVVQFTDQKSQRDDQIRALLEPDYNVRFETVRFDTADLSAAVNDLADAVDQHPADRTTSSWGPEPVLNRVVIGLRELTDVEHYAERIGLTPPYDIYCILPYEVDSENA